MYINVFEYFHCKTKLSYNELHLTLTAAHLNKMSAPRRSMKRRHRYITTRKLVLGVS